MVSNILIIGAGAIGAFYGALLARQGAHVSVVCRSEYQHVKQHGFSIESNELGNWTFKPRQILHSPADFQGKADYVILCTKVLDDQQRIQLINDAISPDTAIVFIQNGVEIEAVLANAFPNHEIISGLAFICSNRIATGKIAHLAYGSLMLGNYPAGVSNKTQHLSKLFEQAGISCTAVDDIITARWQKNVWNAPFNPLSVLSGGLLTLDILTQQEALVRQIMQEICTIAAALGHPLRDDIIDFNINSTYAIAPYKTSMLLDYQHGRAMEIEAILGNAIRAAQGVNVPCPHLDTLYALMQLKQYFLQDHIKMP